MSDNDKPIGNPTVMFCEELAMSLEPCGWPRMAGRILAFLTICSPAHQSQSDIATALSASKASVSTMLGLLEQAGSIVRVPLPGQRKEYYRLSDDIWPVLARRRLNLLNSLASVASRGIVSLNLKGAEAERLRTFVEFQRWCVEEVSKILDGWTSGSKRI